MHQTLCAYCGTKPSQLTSVFCTDCSQPGIRPTHLTTHRYLAALRRLRDQIAAGSRLHADPGDNFPGNRAPNDCNWGLCSRSATQWPDPEDHVWKHAFLTQGRVAPLSLQKGHLCPLDQRLGETDATSWGCFYTCRVFKPQLETPNQESALRYYDQAIALAETLEAAVPEKE